MRRRDLLIIGAGVAAWPLAARAQQRAAPVVGFLFGGSAEQNTAAVAAFRRGLSETGYVEGQNVALEYRWAEGRSDRYAVLAADLARGKVAVILAAGTTDWLRAARDAASMIPTVFVTGNDPVAAGLVASLARPGGNLTGFSIFARELYTKRLELLSELVPQARVMAFITDPNNNPGAAEQVVAELQEAATAKRVQLHILYAGTESEIATAFGTLAQLRVEALVIGSGPFFNDRIERLAMLAAHHAVPAIYSWREYTAAGGLISYGTSLAAIYLQAGIYVGKILKGARPSDLPVQQPTKFELVINLKTAKALGLTVPESLIDRADEVIE